MKDKQIARIEITLIVDDSTGCFTVGDLDFGIGGWVYEWFKKNPEKREFVSRHLEWLAKQCREKEPPFEEFK